MPLQSSKGTDTGYTHYLRFTWEDLQRDSWRDTGTSVDQRKKIAELKAGDVLTYSLFYTSISPSGASDLIMTAGISETGTNIMSSFDMDTSTVATNSGSALSNNRAPFSADSAIWIRIQGTVSTLTAGEWIVALKVLSPQ